MLPEVWQGVYEWYTGVVAPTEWREGLNRTVPEIFLSNDRIGEEFIVLV